MPAWRAARVWALAQADRADDARAAAREVGAGDFAVFPDDAGRLPALVMLANAAHELGDDELAADLLPLLEPFSATWCVLGPGVATLGPVAYAAGLTAAGAGRADAAVLHLEHALEHTDQMDAPPHGERARRALAELRDVEPARP
jgi:hypothetical protein